MSLPEDKAHNAQRPAIGQRPPAVVAAHPSLGNPTLPDVSMSALPLVHPAVVTVSAVHITSDAQGI